MSVEVQRLIRKLQPKGPRSFDEQSWPIYVSIAVLCGYCLGVVLSKLRFDDPRIYANAATWIGLVIIATIAGVISVRLLQNKLLRRTLVLSVLLSMIVNMTVMVIMGFTSIFNSLFEEDAPKAITERPKPEVIVYEYPLFSEDKKQRVPQEYERPVETGVAEAQQRVELTRQSVEAVASSSESLPSPASMSNSNESSHVQRVETPSAPRRSETLAKLSRQPLNRDLTVSRSPSEPIQNKPSPQSAAEQARPQVANVRPQKQERQPDLPTPSTSELTESPQRFNTPKMSRSADTQSNESVASLPTLTKQLRRPRKLPSTSTPIQSESTLPQRNASRALEADSTLMTKSSTSAPKIETSVDLQPQVSTNLRRDRSKVDRPKTDALSESLAKTTLNPRSASVAKVEAPSASESEVSDSQELTSTSAKLQRTRTEAPSNDTVKSPTADQPTLTASSQAVARAQRKTNPSVASSLANAQSISRAERVAQKSTSSNTQVNASSASLVDNASSAPSAKPSRMAFSRSSVGVAGVGDAANLDRGAAAAESPVNISSAAANRAQATQDMEQGAALAPSVSSLTRQMRASDDSPRTSMQAQPIETAMVPGATAAAAEAASSAASVEQAASNAVEASMTAAKGTTEIDLGPTRIATDTGNGRAEGGGQPDLSAGEQPRALQRADTVAGKANIKTDSTADEVATPAAEDVAASEQALPATGAPIARTSTASTASDSGAAGQLTTPDIGDVRIARAGGTRAELSDTADAPQIAAGGNTTRGRQARAMKIKTSTESPVPSLAGVEASSGSRRGDPLDAQGTKPTRQAAGMLVDNDSDFGAAAGDTSVDGTPDSLPSPNFSRSEAASAAVGDNVAMVNENLGTPRRTRTATMTGSSTEVELDPEEFAVNMPSGGVGDSLNDIASSVESSDAIRSSGGATLVEADIPDVEGGLGEIPALSAGIISRQAQEDSEVVSLTPARFLAKRPSAAPAFNSKTNVVSPTKAFRRRVVRKGEELAGERGLPSPKTEAAIELGLIFLSRFQEDDGSWSLNNFADGRAELPRGEQAAMVSDTAATGLALLSFLGAGYHHQEDKYQETIGNAINFLLAHQKEDGDLYVDSDSNSSRSAWLYSHGIASIALCEAYGMTQDPKLKEPAQDAIDFIVESQHQKRGGWRYSPGYGSDTSVSGWMTMAMKSAELADLSVPEEAYDKIRHWLDLSQVSDAQPYLYRYNPYAPDTEQQRHGRKPTRAITGVGLLMRLYTGWRRDDPKMILGARTLAQNPPQIGTSTTPRRDTYYWYYATQVMYHMGGEYWEDWNSELHPLLAKTQLKDGKLMGSWNPQMPVPDRWGAHGGRLYVTALNLLSLEVFYRHLPIYEDSKK